MDENRNDFYSRKFNSQDNSGQISTPLHKAASEGKEYAIYQMLNSGININARDAMGRTALMIAIERGYQNITKILLEAGTDADLQDNNRDNALLLSIKIGQYGLADIILDYIRDINLAGEDGKTALHLLTEKKEIKIAEKLISKGADVDAVDSKRRTSLMLASKNNDFEFVVLLVKHNADPSKKDLQNLSAKELTDDRRIRNLLENASHISLQNYHTEKSDESSGLFQENLIRNKSASLLSFQNKPPRFQNTFASSPEIPLKNKSLIEFPLDSISEPQVPNKRYTYGINTDETDENIKVESFDPTIPQESALPKSTSNVFKEQYSLSLSNANLNNQSEIDLTISSTLPKYESPDYFFEFNVRRPQNENFQQIDKSSRVDLHQSSFSSVENEDDSSFRSSLTKDLPPKQNYKSVKFDWDKLYDVEDDYGTVKLLKDSKFVTTIESISGGLDSLIDDHNISESDLIGFQMYFTPDEELKVDSNKLYEFVEALKITQFSQKQLMMIREWLKVKKQNSVKYTNECEMHLKHLRKLMAERKYLKTNIKKLQSISEHLKDELNHYPTKQQVQEYKSSIDSIRIKLKDLNNDHMNSINKLQTVKEAIDKEFRKYFDLENNFSHEADTMISENNALEKLVDTFMEDAQNAHKHLLRKLGSSLKTIDKLNLLIEKAKFLLEEKFKHVNELYSLLSDQHHLSKSIKCSLEAMKKYKEQLDAVLNVLQSKSKSFADLISELENDLKEIYRNFGNVKGNLEIKIKLENENGANFSELKRLLKLLDVDKQDVVKVGKQLGKLKKLTEAEIEKDKNETLKEINDQSYQEEENRSVWEKKIKSVFEFIAELRAMVAENKEEETDISQLKYSFDEKCNFTEEERVQETLKLSKAFVCSDETTGKVCTISGFNEMEEITYLQQKDDDIFRETNLATKQIFKSSYSIASQDVENIPENVEQRLKGIFYRQGGKKSIKK